MIIKNKFIFKLKYRVIEKKYSMGNINNNNKIDRIVEKLEILERNYIFIDNYC